jgi:hypothetical protein
LSLLLISTLYELVIDESNGSMFKSHSWSLNSTYLCLFYSMHFTLSMPNMDSGLSLFYELKRWSSLARLFSCHSGCWLKRPKSTTLNWERAAVPRGL